MDDVIFVGASNAAPGYRDAGITSYHPAPGHLAERVLAERRRCRVIAMTEDTFAALPDWLAGELQQGASPILALVPAGLAPGDTAGLSARLRAMTSGAPPTDA